MLNRFLPVRPAWWAFFGAAILFASSVVAIATSESALLDRDVLTRSRGGLSYLVLTQTACNLKNGNYPCSVAGDPCATCDQNTFTDVMMGAFGGYHPTPVLVGCGNNFQGHCDAALNCLPDQPPYRLGVCASPQQVAVQ